MEEALIKIKEKYKKLKETSNVPVKEPKMDCLKKSSVIYAFITFRSMDGFELYDKAYSPYSKLGDRLMILYCGCFCKKERERLRNLYIGGKWPHPK